MTLRIQLLLLSLLTLVLPWAGCQYAKQMEGVLRNGQEEALKTTAGTLARVVATDPAFVAMDSAVPEYYATALQVPPRFDGFADEWPTTDRELPSDTQDARGRDRKLRLGLYQGALFVFLAVRDPEVEHENPTVSDVNLRPPDRIVLLMETPRSGDDDAAATLQAWSISAVAPGPIIAHRATNASPWSPQPTIDSSIRGVWRAATDGYDVELRIPQKLIGSKVAIFSVDSMTDSPANHELAPLTQRSVSLQAKLEQYTPRDTRISVLDAQGWILARTDSLDTAGTLVRNNMRDQEINWHRLFLRRTETAPPPYGLPYGMWGEPIDAAQRGGSSAIWFRDDGDEPSIVRAAVPIFRGGRVAGVIAVERPGDDLLRQRDTALETMIDQGLYASLLVATLMLAFYVWIVWRIRRLSKAAALALSPDGRIEHRLPDINRRDELGNLSRSFATLLQRFNEYAQYLQTLGSKLTHEIRTPLAIVASSLENLAAEPDGRNAQRYIERARDGTKRLQTMLTAMSEATRVEQSIEQADRIDFDLAELLSNMATAYQQTFAAHRIGFRIPNAECRFVGAPDLIAQMLDKLMDNATDFCLPDGEIDIELESNPKQYRLIVRNQGPPLPEELVDKLFDAMVGSRAGQSERPHLGLGLYIVQLIVRFHRGQVRAYNVREPQGVAFEITLPRQ